ncbi:hypothetical protein HAX54_030277 [Datura stramonium]|uniref:MADS-box domain-containing protein n=1 Tax=Datura stramonium TaxID=4076 RepID=A0ABS8V8F7_DATST|nr:hypothetical protein [Datura stramonium]
MEGKKTAGRQKIPLKKIENEASRHATFSKRRSGLYKKASELVREFDVDLGIVLSSPTGKPHSFVHPTSEVVFDRFMNPTNELGLTSQLVVAHSRANVNQYNTRLNELDAREKIANQKLRIIDENNKTRNVGWWESIDDFNADDIAKLEAWLNAGEFQLNNRLKKLQNGASSSSQFPPENADN